VRRRVVQPDVAAPHMLPWKRGRRAAARAAVSSASWPVPVICMES
jgi:hypothetical protein